MADPQFELLYIEMQTDGAPAEMAAAAAAFALIAAADGSVDASEKSVFGLIAKADEHLRQAFDGYLSELRLQPESATEGILEQLAEFKNSGKPARRILRAAQMAIVADGDVNEGEEVAVGQIAVSLGLDPGTV